MLEVDIVPVQQQKGAVDCGIFSIANAFNAAFGQNLETVTYNQEKMREHLQKCFEDRCLRRFPQSGTDQLSITRCEARHIKIEMKL